MFCLLLFACVSSHALCPADTFNVQSMVKGCAGLLLTLLVIADPGCFGQDDHGNNEDIVLVSLVFDFIFISNP